VARWCPNQHRLGESGASLIGAALKTPRLSAPPVGTGCGCRAPLRPLRGHFGARMGSWKARDDYVAFLIEAGEVVL